MTNQHPLTSEMVQDIWNEVAYEKSGRFTQDDHMRAAADWQLEQVIKYLDRDFLIVLWSNHLPVSTHMDRFKKAMRPQEDKPMTDHMRSVANKAITEARAMLESLVSDGSIDRQTYYDLMGEFEETMLPEEDN